MRVFFDTNVLFASLYNPQGTPAKLLAYCWHHPDIKGISSFYVKQELARIVQNKLPAALGELKKLERKLSWLDDVSVENDPLEIRAKDLPVYRAALFHSSDILVTGDHRDFSSLMSRNYRNLLRILNPADCLLYVRSLETTDKGLL